MGSVHPYVRPNRLDGIVFGAIGRQRAKLEAMSVTGEPLLPLRSGMIGGVVVDEEDFLPAVTLRQGREKHRVGIALEHLPVSRVESGPVEIARAKYLLGVALTGRRNRRLMSAPRPSLVERRVLAETGFVTEQPSGFAFGGFFLAWDRCIAASGLAAPGRP